MSAALRPRANRMFRAQRRAIPVLIEALESRTMLDVTFTVDATSGHQAISPYIYGTNYGQATGYTGYTFARVGGNRWTAYNWTNNFSNAGNDWPYSNDNLLSSSTVPGAAVANIIVDTGNRHVPLVLTIPTNGYVSQAKTGNVSITDPNRWTTWFVPEYARKGSTFTLTPTGTGPVYQDEFVNWVKQTYPATQTDPTRPVWYCLDNEPDLWSSTHPEVHPNAATYAEMVQDTISYASAIKDVSAISLVFGPVNYSWFGMQTLQNAPDMSIAGSLTFQQYYLQQVHNAEVQAGRKLLDVDDVHAYTEAEDADGVRISGASVTQNSIDARVQSARSLYDPTYVENSWITRDYNGHQPIDLLHHMQNDIATYDPGTKIAITEYDYGAGQHISGGIAEAEALGAFGKMGVFAASYWQLASDTSYVVSAFNMYRNYDGSGGKFGDTTATASTTSMDQSAIFASVDSTDPNRIVLVAINRTGGALTSHFNLTALGPLVSGNWYALTGSGSTIQNMGGVTFSGSGTFDVNLPAYSVNTFALTISQSGAVVTPSFSPGPGTYYTTQSVTITCGTPNSVIRYTTDGTLPTSSYGTIYTGPLSLSTTTVLSAIAYAPGKPDSAVRTGTYTFASKPLVYIYQDALASDWADWSWGCTRNFANTSPVKNGTDSIAVTYTDGWTGLYLHKGTAIDAAGYSAFKFWVNGGSSNKSLLLILENTSTSYAFTATANTWSEITVPLSSVGSPTSITGFYFQNNTASAQTVMYIDDIRLVSIDAAPFVAAATVNGGLAQRSRVTKLTVTFSEAVTLSAGAFTLYNRSGAVVPNVTLNAANTLGDQMTWDITFTGSALQSGSLADGTYRLKVSAAAVADSGSNHMAADYRLRFFRLFGDSNGDRMVNNTDLIAFRAALAGTYVSYFDFDNNGLINSADYAQFRKRLIMHP